VADPTRKNRFAFTENQMAVCFLELACSQDGLPGLGSFDAVYGEVSCHTGRPDFLAVRYLSTSETVEIGKSTGHVGSGLLSLLKPRSPRTLKYLIDHSEYTADSVRRSLGEMVNSGLVAQNSNGSFLLGPAATVFDSEIWSFELKLSSPKRAVFQAQQSRAYANCAYIVVPPGKEGGYERYSEPMNRWGIGLATFDPEKKRFAVIKRCRKDKPYSRQHRVYAVSNFNGSRDDKKQVG
jgi:hypothetical protein